MNSLASTTITNYKTIRGVQYKQLNISYQIHGKALHTAPIVVVFHALTGNSDVASAEKGWWKDVVGNNKVIDLNHFTVIAFNILGNGYDGQFIDDYAHFTAKDIAILSYQTLVELKVTSIDVAIGGSLGGGIAWELTLAYPSFAKKLIAIGSDWKSTDWIKGICGTQQDILLHSSQGVADARKMAMLFYRSPQSLDKKFNGEKQNDEIYKVTSWLNHHGQKLEKRFSKKAYLMMNHLLANIDADLPHAAKNITTTIIQIGISSDILFPAERNKKTQTLLNELKINNHYYEIVSDEGHDAFLIEYPQLTAFLKEHF